ncbi:MAG TPA: LytTR family DNA-binding domain-containing protein, partial [Puia sp.]|nr:LytTR family DNA-binding domain-containing protein [Puia sp.]
VFAICRDSGRHIVNYTLDQLEALLDPGSYFRLNRSFISSIRSIKEVRKYFNSRLRVYLSPPPEKEVLISRIKVADFINWMG